MKITEHIKKANNKTLFSFEIKFKRVSSCSSLHWFLKKFEIMFSIFIEVKRKQFVLKMLIDLDIFMLLDKQVPVNQVFSKLWHDKIS